MQYDDPDVVIFYETLIEHIEFVAGKGRNRLKWNGMLTDFVSLVLMKRGSGVLAHKLAIIFLYLSMKRESFPLLGVLLVKLLLYRVRRNTVIKFNQKYKTD